MRYFGSQLWGEDWAVDDIRAEPTFHHMQNTWYEWRQEGGQSF